mmetsp:Transcript_27954/g.80575  ORF Transcript_27954/g.80575 Transcript_27954/m.80575 type:complete len:205 (+) Transcript_27954:653-1267(+)
MTPRQKRPQPPSPVPPPACLGARACTSCTRRGKGDSPAVSGLSRSTTNSTAATTTAMIPGILKPQRQPPNATPAATARGARAPPRLFDVFQIAQYVPRSSARNQASTILAQAGEPRPCHTPLPSHNNPSSSATRAGSVAGSTLAAMFVAPVKSRPHASRREGEASAARTPKRSLLTPSESWLAVCSAPTCERRRPRSRTSVGPA